MSGRRLLFVVNDTTIFASHRLPVAVAAREAGFEVALAALDTVGSSRSCATMASPIIRWRSTVPASTRCTTSACSGELRRLIRTVRPTLIHTVTIKPVIYGGIAARLCAVPSLVSAVSGLGQVFVDDSRRP